MKNYLKPEQLKNGYTYRIDARNADYGIWIKKRGSFIISRIKFGLNYLFEEIHWDLDDHYGTVRPIKILEKCPYNITISTSFFWMSELIEEIILMYLNDFEGERRNRR